MNALRLESVTKRFGDTVAVDDVAFELGDHEILALVGPSGCGKSTLLRSIAGLLPIDAGTIHLGDRVVDDGRRSLPPERRNVGLVFQEHALFPHLTVSGNVAFGVRTGDATTRSQEMLDIVGLAGYGERYPHELSGGERQRVALARAMAPSPTLLLLDEPFASLDPNLRSQVRDDVANILRSTGTPAVFVTHDQNEALAVGDRVAVMRGGQLVQLGTPEAVFHQPSDRFVASFMGEADFLEWDEAVAVIAGIDSPAGSGTVAMLRPDDVTFTKVPDGAAVVTQSEFRGSSWCYTLELAGGRQIRSSRSHLRRFDIGERVAPSMRPGHVPVAIPSTEQH